VSSVVHRLIIWKVLKTQLFPAFSGLRAIPQAEVRIIKNLKSNEFVSAVSEGVTRPFCESADSKWLRAILMLTATLGICPSTLGVNSLGFNLANTRKHST
jgi:hypothetical protein